MNIKQVAGNIKKFRKVLGLSQKNLAVSAGVNYVTLTKIENGTISNPSFPIVSQLAEALRVGVEDLVYSEEDSRRSAPKTLVDYQELLNKVGSGKSDVVGYAYMAGKINTDTRIMMSEYRQKLAEANRQDKFVIPATLENIEIVESEKDKKNFQEIFDLRYIPAEVFSEHMDIYLWDNSVGICFFKNDNYQVKLYDCPLVYAITKAFCDLLWNMGDEDFNKIKGVL